MSRLPLGVYVALALPFGAAPAADDVLLREKIPQVIAPIIVDIEIAGHGKHRMVLDTAATLAVFDSGLRPLTGPSIADANVSASGTETPATAYRAPAMKAQGLTLAAPFVVVMDIRKLSRFLGEGIEGVVGLQNLGPDKVLFDHDGLVVEVHSGPWRLQTPAAREVALDEKAPTPVFEAALDGQPIRWEITSASDGCVTLSAQVFDSLVAKGMIQASADSKSVRTVDGWQSFRNGWFVRGELMGKKLAGVSVASGRGAELGRGWLRGFDVEIDFIDRKLRYQPCASPSPPLDTGEMIGADLVYDKSGIRLDTVKRGGAAYAADLREGDGIEEFGPLKSGDMNAASVADVIAANAGGTVTVRYRRKIDHAPAVTEVRLPAAISYWSFAGRNKDRPASADTILVKQKIHPPPALHTMEARIGGKDRLVALDTGADSTVFDSSLEGLLLPENIGGVITDGSGEKVQTKRFEGPTIDLQSLAIKRPAVAVANLGSLSAVFGLKFEAMIGYSDFVTGKLFVDYDAGLLEIHDGPWRLQGSDCGEIILEKERSRPSFRADVSGHSVEFVVDTGYNGCFTISSQLFDALAKDGTIEVAAKEGKSVSLSGVSSRRQGWFVAGTLMGKELRGVSVESSNIDHAIMGLGWLCGFNFEIDRRACAMRYRQAASPHPPVMVSLMTGFRIIYGAQGPEVYDVREGGKGPAAEAGLQPGDRIERFGPLAAGQMNMGAVGEVVVAAAGKSLGVTYVRKSDGTRTETELKLPALVSVWNFAGRDIYGVAPAQGAAAK